jgi:hypothetical protein
MQTTKVTIEDLNTISKIAERAVALYAKVGLRADLVVMADNVLVVHKEVVPLRLQEMLVADDGNFAHDIGGIARHQSVRRAARVSTIASCRVSRRNERRLVNDKVHHDQTTPRRTSQRPHPSRQQGS